MSQIKVGKIRKLKTCKTTKDQAINEMIDNRLKEEGKQVTHISNDRSLHIPKSSQVAMSNDTESTKSSKSLFKKPKVEEEPEAEQKSLYRKEFIDDKPWQEIVPPKTEVLESTTEEKPQKKRGLFGSIKSKD